MSLENSVDRIIELVSDSHEAVKAKGGTTATPYLLTNLPEAIESIPEATGEDVTAETNAYTTELAELTTAVTALETELAGKAAGSGGAVETCTVRPYLESDGLYYGTGDMYYATVYRDGVISTIYGEWNWYNITESNPITDVVCGSAFVLTGGSKGGAAAYNGASLTHKESDSCLFAMPQVEGADVQLYISSEIV